MRSSAILIVVAAAGLLACSTVYAKTDNAINEGLSGIATPPVLLHKPTLQGHPRYQRRSDTCGSAFEGRIRSPKEAGCLGDFWALRVALRMFVPHFSFRAPFPRCAGPTGGETACRDRMHYTQPGWHFLWHGHHTLRRVPPPCFPT